MTYKTLSAIAVTAVVSLMRTPASYAQASCPSTLAHERLHSVLWLQRSAESTASASQAFQVATRNLGEALRDPTRWPEAVTPAAPESSRPPAIIVDVDETILDNTPEEAALIAGGRRKFDPGIWDAWQERANAEPIAGALDFIRQASEKGVLVFYVTNRTNESRLRDNLARRGFPLAAKPDVVLVPGECSTGGTSTDKECRRQDIAKNYRVLLLLGDDFADFMSVAGLTADDRIKRARDYAVRWGREWIILSNPAYGSWERAFYDPKNDDCDVILLKKLIALEGPK
jgi:acid phosphatase